MNEKYHLFWKNRSPLSNWYKAPFHFAGTNFNCSEQYMMWAKAMLFGDYETAIKIKLAANPSEQKALGRQVVGFNEDVWKANCVSIMVDGLVAKFTQNEECYKALEATRGKVIAEASPVDNIWGIGLAEDDPRAWDETTWQGQNLLGICLMKVRDEIWKPT